jgi:1,4-alpha-glucan branching enzyme
MKKVYLKDKRTCKVKFEVHKSHVGPVKSVNIVGCFNNWDKKATPMRITENGSFEATLELKPGREYQYLYLIDGTYWDCDRDADKMVKDAYGISDNSVVVV